MDEITTDKLFIALLDSNFDNSVDILLQELCNRFPDESENKYSVEEFQMFFNTIFKILFSNNINSNSTINLCLVLLNNITINESYSLILCNNFNDFIIKIIKEFLRNNPLLDDNVDNNNEYNDPWQYVSSVICNLALLNEGRQLLLKKSNEIFPALLIQIKSKNNIRRRGVISCIRSCLFDENIHWWFIEELGGLSHLLYPLVTNRPFTTEEKIGMDSELHKKADDINAKHEDDIELLKLNLESILLLCKSRVIREILRSKKVYAICRNLDLSIDDEDIGLIIYEIVNFLMRDEHDQLNNF